MAIYLQGESEHSYATQDAQCNTAYCIEAISIAQVSLGIVAIGNPISVGVVAVSR